MRRLLLILALLLAPMAHADSLDSVPEYLGEAAGTEVTVIPAPGGQVDERRPEVGAMFTRPIRSFRLEVDGQDLTDLAALEGRVVRWSPGYDLDLGRHTVLLRATDSLGASLARTWVFDVLPAGTAAWRAPEPEGALEPEADDGEPIDQEEGLIPLRVTNPEPEATVNDIFNVQGTTAPGARVLVEVWDPGVAMEPVVTTKGRSAYAEGIADASGHFDIELDVTDEILATTEVRLTVAAATEDGRGASPVFFPLVIE